MYLEVKYRFHKLFLVVSVWCTERMQIGVWEPPSPYPPTPRTKHLGTERATQLPFCQHLHSLLMNFFLQMDSNVENDLTKKTCLIFLNWKGTKRVKIKCKKEDNGCLCASPMHNPPEASQPEIQTLLRVLLAPEAETLLKFEKRFGFWRHIDVPQISTQYGLKQRCTGGRLVFS